MTIKQFTTSERRLTITIVKNCNGSYSAYENRIQKEGGTILILHSWCLHWLIDTLHVRHLPEKLEVEF